MYNYSLHLFSRTLIFFVSVIIGGSLFAQVSMEVVERIDVEPAWAGNQIFGYFIHTDEDDQFVAYYDADKQNMTVAQRKLNETSWSFTRLPSNPGRRYSNHDDITMLLDRNKHLHVTFNMHGNPLVYYRSEKPLDASSLVRVPKMIGRDEERCTYFEFQNLPNEKMLATYRSGGSGNGNQVWNQYDPDTQTWSRLHDVPILDGQGKMNPYIYGPILGPDGWFHLTWCWRDTGDCRTNHDYSYARSRDLKHWETCLGEQLELPITFENSRGTSVIVDPVPVGGGFMNPNQRVGFDSKGRLVLSYGKYDQDSFYQVYNARLDASGWTIRKASDWDYHWDFSGGGGGAVPLEIQFGPVESENGKLVQSFTRQKQEDGRLVLDEETLEQIGSVPGANPWPLEIDQVELDIPGIESRTARDLRDKGKTFGQEPSIRYILKWDMLPSNRDKPYEKTPPPTMLRVYKLRIIP